MSRDFFGEMRIKKSGDAQLGKFCCATKRGGVAQQRKFPWATEKILLGKGKISLGQGKNFSWAREFSALGEGAYPKRGVFAERVWKRTRLPYPWARYTR